jgi:putative membrane protein
MRDDLTGMAVRTLIDGFGVFLVAKLLPGITVKGYFSAVVFALVVGIFNAIAWHFFAPLTLTFAVLTLGVGALVVNGLLFLLAGKVVKGVEISGCFTAAIASVCVTVVNWMIHGAVGR